MGKVAFFQKGADGRKRLQKEKDDQERRRAMMGPMRWWLANYTEGSFTFLDTPDFFFMEHNLKIDGKWGNHVTCIKDFSDECPPCESGNNPSYVLVATVISHKPYTSKKTGKVVNHQRMLLVLKGKARDKILRQIKKQDGDLKFCVYEVARGADKNEVSTGEDFSFEGRTSSKKLLKLKPDDTKLTDQEWLAPFEYAKIFAPKKEDELREYLGYGPAASVGSKEEEEEDEKPKVSKEEDDSDDDDEDTKGASEDDDDEPAVGSGEEEEEEEKPKKPKTDKKDGKKPRSPKELF